MNIKVVWLSKNAMHYALGEYYLGYTRNYPNGTSIIYLCTDMPQRVKDAVYAHELKHAEDRAFLDGRVWYWEARAWWAQLTAEPLGTLQALWLTLTDRDRLSLYWYRIKKGL